MRVISAPRGVTLAQLSAARAANAQSLLCGKAFPRGSGRGCSVVVCAGSPPPTQKSQKREAQRTSDVRLRAEVESPWSAVRLTGYGVFLAATGIASLIATTQLIASAGGAKNAIPLDDALQTWGIDVVGFVVFFLLLRRELEGREKQMARMMREERLADCRIELANGKTAKLGTLRSFSRVVIAAGNQAQVAEAIAAAEPFKKELMDRGVYVVACPIFSEPNEESVLEPPTKEEMKYRGQAMLLDEWRAWFDEQIGEANNVSTANGLYVGLRLDGRVRASGKGCPPWERFVMELAPQEGMWKGLFDGMDGRV